MPNLVQIGKEKNIKYMQNYIRVFTCHFHESHKCWEVLCRDLYRISLKWVKENGRYLNKLIYALQHSMVVTGTVSTKLVLP